MLISDVMKRTGLTRKAIYLYEERGLLRPQKVDSGTLSHREYTEEDVERLITIARLRELDVPLAQIVQILETGRVELVLQEHLLRQQEKLAKLNRTIDSLHTILQALPPNSGTADFVSTADRVLPRVLEGSLCKKLEEDYPKGYVRRIAVLLYEAFLDKPLDTRERWNAWYSLLERMEQGITPRLLDAYTEFYGGLTTEQLCEDYRLRRRLVCGYTTYGPMEERAKAQELLHELKRLAAEPVLCARWMRFYKMLVKEVLECQPETTMDYVVELSSVYESYQTHFYQMQRKYLDPYFKTKKGELFAQRLLSCMEGEDILRKRVLIFFDFYNNTLRAVLHPEDMDTILVEEIP